MPREVRHALFLSRLPSRVAGRSAPPKAVPQRAAKRDHQKVKLEIWFLFLMVTRHAPRVAAFGVADVTARSGARESLARAERAERALDGNDARFAERGRPALEFEFEQRAERGTRARAQARRSARLR